MNVMKDFAPPCKMEDQHATITKDKSAPETMSFKAFCPPTLLTQNLATGEHHTQPNGYISPKAVRHETEGRSWYDRRSKTAANSELTTALEGRSIEEARCQVRSDRRRQHWLM